LIERGVPVTIWGNRWEKSPHFNLLKKNWKGTALHGRDYVAAIQGSKICLGMLSKGNRDMHTTRSLEVPFAGGLLCAERTAEHQQLYTENVEAVFWKDADECADVCLRLLKEDAAREEIRKRGMLKVLSLQMGNEQVCRQILESLTLVDASLLAR
jgi:spore maturation protein CgeB